MNHAAYDLNNGLIVQYLGHGLNDGPFDDRTCLDHLNTRHVCNSDPQCTYICVLLTVTALEKCFDFKVERNYSCFQNLKLYMFRFQIIP